MTFRVIVNECLQEVLTRTMTLVHGIRPRDRLISTIITRSDKIITTDDLESWSEPTSKRRMSVINPSIEAGMLRLDTRLREEPKQH